MTPRSWNIESRRGAAIIAAVAAMAIVHLMVVGSIAPAGAESETALLRAQGLRALQACDSGMVVVIGSLITGSDLPEVGQARTLGASSFIVMSVPADGEAGTLVIEGHSGDARRRLAVELE